MDEIYLDYHTTTPIDEQVIAAMQPFISQKWGNYLQSHRKGQELTAPLTAAFKSIYALIDADENQENFIFTSSNQEAVAHVFQIVYKNAVHAQGKNHLITIAIEDAPILMNMKKMEGYGCKSSYLPLTDQGIIDEKKIIEEITPRTSLISISLAHGALGIIQPIEKIKEICKLRGIYLHLDISYAIGKIDLKYNELQADFITFGGDKFFGPKSSGGLYIRPKIAIEPLICGGLEQGGYRGGILDTAQVVGLGVACKLAKENLMEMCLEVAGLRDQFEKMLSEKLGTDIHIWFKNSLRLPNTTLVSFSKVTADSLLYALNHRKLYATLGGVSFQKLGALLETIGHNSLNVHGTLLFAFSRQTSFEQVKKAVQVIVEEVQRLQQSVQDVEQQWD